MYICVGVCVFVYQILFDIGTSLARRPTTAFGSLAIVRKMLCSETRCIDSENYTEDTITVC